MFERDGGMLGAQQKNSAFLLFSFASHAPHTLHSLDSGCRVAHLVSYCKQIKVKNSPDSHVRGVRTRIFDTILCLSSRPLAQVSGVRRPF